MLDMLQHFDPNDPLVYHPQGILTRGQFARLVHYVEKQLAQSSPAAGDRVLLALPNSLELLTAYYACLSSGLVAVPVNERQTGPEIQRIVHDCNPVITITNETTSRRLETGQSGLSITHCMLENLHLVALSELEFPTPAREWHDDHPAIIFYTSGSTGAPKGVVYNHRTLRENSRIYRQRFNLDSADRAVLVHCMAHNFVFTQNTVPFLDAGGSVQVVDFGSVEQTAAALEGGASFLSLIPWFGFDLLAYCETHGTRADSLRVCLFGGDRIPEDLFRECPRVLGIPASQNIGMTETNTYAVNHGNSGMDKQSSAGRALPDVRIQIRDPAGKVCSPGVSGEIWVSTPAGMHGYWNNDQLTRNVIQDGWIATGDAGHFDNEGFLWFDARIRNIIIHDGDNIYPSEVENEINRHPAVSTSAVVGVPNTPHGETVASALVCRPGQTVDLEELRSFLRPRLSATKIPDYALVLDALPLTRSGKVDREALSAMLLKTGK